ncbi:unnamed protein product [Prorocentrum cordatum]|uniref:Secreted protein n=1 Tax=Prorocentrum cordatum TaxID=2364126 RepID=A0ABN9WIT3_9DINO|nr:unnamed protein product [Polarella glacialis]
MLRTGWPSLIRAMLPNRTNWRSNNNLLSLLCLALLRTVWLATRLMYECGMCNIFLRQRACNASNLDSSAAFSQMAWTVYISFDTTHALKILIFFAGGGLE